MKTVKYLILGNGIAGWTAAQKLRANCSEEEILIVTREAKTTIKRPLLSKTAMQGFCYGVFDLVSTGEAIPVMENTQVLKIRPEEHLVETSKGTIHYESCIYALGAENFIPPIKGKDLKGVFSVRTQEDYLRIRRAAFAGKNVVIIGGGVIGMEMAELFCQEGKKVTVLETQPRLLPRVLDETCAAVYQKKLMEAASENLVVRCNVKDIEICGDNQVTSVKCSGEVVSADLCLFACGVRPDMSLAKEAGIQAGRGILVDEHMRTNFADIYACGDCAEFRGQMPALWKPAIKMGEIAAANAAGDRAVYVPEAFPVIISSKLCSLYAAGESVVTDQPGYEVTCQEKTVNQKVRITRQDEKVFEKIVRKDGIVCGRVLIGNLSGMAEEM